MTRGEMLDVANKLMVVLNECEVTHNDAETIATIFKKAVGENIEKAQRHYLSTGVFAGEMSEI